MIPHLFLFLSARLLSACMCGVPVLYIINTLVTEWDPGKNLTIENLIESRDIFSTQLHLSPGAHHHLSPRNISMGKQISVDFQQRKKYGIYQVPNTFSYRQ
ncbi:hypothetical protein EDB85DRAFT_1141007 [Lactarius pseudohatsudake]|nr:hypothetical protein EDB85DRAFT_1141007 [Lactarius pseudohatsudake]